MVRQSALAAGLQGYLANKKTPTSLGPPYDPRHRPTVGSKGGAFSCTWLTRLEGHRVASTPFPSPTAIPTACTLLPTAPPPPLHYPPPPLVNAEGHLAHNEAKPPQILQWVFPMALMSEDTQHPAQHSAPLGATRGVVATTHPMVGPMVVPGPYGGPRGGGGFL